MKRQEDHRDFILVCYSHNPHGDLDKKNVWKEGRNGAGNTAREVPLKAKKSATKNGKSTIPRTNKWYGANNT